MGILSVLRPFHAVADGVADDQRRMDVVDLYQSGSQL